MTKQIRYFIGLALLLAAVSASAQTTHILEVKVPFPFVTAGKSWPAADYRVEVKPVAGMLTLSAPGLVPTIMLTNHDDRPGERPPYLRFQRSGDFWILEEVTLDGTAQVLRTGSELEKTLANLNLARQEQLVAADPTTH